MKKSQKQIEQRALIIGASIYFILSICSYIVYFMTGIEAMFLDASFSLITTLSTVAAIFISKYSAKKSDKFPQGLFVLEPFYGIIKALLILTVTVLSCIQVSQSAFSYFVYGQGEILNYKPIIPYSILCTVSCIFLHFFYKRKNATISNASTMLDAESRSTLIDSVMCLGIGLLAFFATFIKEGQPLDFLLYTGDFFVTVILSLVMIKEPFTILRKSFSELANGTMPENSAKLTIEKAIKEQFSTELMKGMNYSIMKTGMNFRVMLAIKKENEEMNMSNFWVAVKNLDTELSKKYEYLQLEVTLY